ncbi:unnamed protein product [Sympodiomycopsis kandeliae]
MSTNQPRIGNGKTSTASSQGSSIASRNAPANQNASQQSQGDGMTTTSSSANRGAIVSGDLVKKTRDLIQLADELRSCGTSLDISIPSIAIIGNQSSGKSSVIEAISGVSLPRSSGTCTRCPIEVRLSNSDCDWECHVSLRSDSEEVPFGPVIKDSLIVQDRLKRAQLALLSGTALSTLDTSAYLTTEIQNIPQSHSQLSFTSSSICLSIHSRDVINLSFVDLPGLISNVGCNESEEQISIIENMSWNAITRDSCITLLTITCLDDIQNQSGAALARRADPAGKRTIGVLTKPDQIQEGDHHLWIDILTGKKEKLEHGYYAVRNPNSRQLSEKLTSASTRRIEKEFFNPPPWSKLEQKFRKRLGTQQLAQRLSELLQQSIQHHMPAMAEQLETVLNSTTTQLDALPRHVPDGQAVAFVAGLCNQFARQLESSVLGTAADESSPLLRNVKNQALDKFVQDIDSARPEFFPNQSTMKLAYVDGEEHSHAVVADQDGQLVSDAASFGKKQRVMYTFADVKSQVDQLQTIQLPGSVPYSMKFRLIRESFEHIPHLAMQCFETAKRLFKKTVDDLVAVNFGAYRVGGLAAEVDTILGDAQKSCQDDFCSALQILLSSDSKFAYTSNLNVYISQRDLIFNELKEMYLESLSNESDDAVQSQENPVNEEGHQSASEQNTNARKRSRSVFEDTNPQQQDNIYDDVLRVCAEVQSYWQIASAKFVDIVPSLIVVNYLQAFTDNVPSILGDQLGIYSDQAQVRCIQYLAEHTDTMREREELQGRKDRVQQGLAALRRFALD